MSPPSSNAPASGQPPKKVSPVERIKEHIKPFFVPYYLLVAAVLGAITAGFAIVVVLIILVVTNFNVLGWME